ncbi:aldo/keto reductase [Aestuariivirga litoralis]|uniref:aldo/keto reductase n=1 Tax=Aestuariivirga litoralis TaxID=2650924 RepID=UPI0018C6DCFE|nr:aldo/keto reductase [Aestuariivirga litoralis]MBG1232320.1 aldo/keto reductase [Aestuariivirga litoralis]
MQRIKLASDYEISRVIRGGWQLSGSHSNNVSDDPVADMVAFADAGITTFDCADIYTGVEELIGNFRAEYLKLRGAEALALVKVHTKFVPDMAKLATISKAYVQDVIDTSLRRLKMDCLDVVQFHWWDYGIDNWLQTALWLEELRKAGKIHRIGGTNFDTPHFRAISETGVPMSSMQVQYSLLDRRPENTFIAEAQTRDLAIFCYGTVAGGFLGDKWLGAPEPKAPLENRSLVKYKLIIDDFGGWALFQELLAALSGIAKKNKVDIATIASAAMLQRPGVSSVIVGARNRSHLVTNLKVADIQLAAEDLAAIEKVLAKSTPLEGDVYALERDVTGRHGSIMKYNLNDEAKEKRA